MAVACLMHGLAAAGGGRRLACSLPNARSSSCWSGRRLAVACLMQGLAAAGGGRRLAVACLM